jgi:hypothetical protein
MKRQPDKNKQSERNPTMKNLKVTINRSAGVKKYEVLPRQEKDMRGCCFCIKTQTARKNENTQFPVEKSAAE